MRKLHKKYFFDPVTNIIMINHFPAKPLKYKEFRSRILIRKSFINDCLEGAHAPQFGNQKTYNFVCKSFSGKGMFKDNKDLCKHCAKCLKSKPKHKITLINRISQANLKSGELLALGIVGKLHYLTIRHVIF